MERPQVFNTGPLPFFRVEKAGKIAVFHTVFIPVEPSQSPAATAPPKGELFAICRSAQINLPLRGRWHRAAMTERVRALPGRPGCCRFRQRLSLWESWTRSGLRGLGCCRFRQRLSLWESWTRSGLRGLGCCRDRFSPRRGEMSPQVTKRGTDVAQRQKGGAGIAQ